MRQTRRSGISDVLTSLILVMATVSLSSVFFFWALGYLGQSQNAIALGISQGNARVQEQLSVDGVLFVSGNTQITVYVRNFGDLPLTVDQVFVNGNLCPGTSPTTVTARAVRGITVVLNAPCTSWVSGATYTITVASQRGNTYQASYAAP